MSDKENKYLLGTENQLKWRDKYFFGSNGNGFLEPGSVPLDDARMSAYNIAKSSYQIRPEVFNIEYLSEDSGLERQEVINRLQRLYEDHLIMFVMNPATQIYGWGLYYWFVNLKEGVSATKKQKLSDWFQNKDDICTGYETEGDFDFFNGNHMRVLDNLLYDVIDPWKHNPEVESVYICPVRRDIRESHVNMWDVPTDKYRKSYWSHQQLDKLAGHQDKMDKKDLQLFVSLNKRRPVEDYFNFDVMAEISGLNADEMRQGMKEIIEEKRILVPVFFLNFMKLQLSNHMFVIRTFQNIPDYRKSEIADELTAIPDFNMVLEFSDAQFDILAAAYREISDIESLKSRINEFSEVEEIKEADISKQYRRWVCRLDDKNGFWEECIFTDDFLEDRTKNHTSRVNLDREGEK